jgi:hypothetical protein
MSMNMLPLFAIAAFCLAGCGIVLTGDTEDKVQPHGVYQAERVNLARYKSVQTRPGQNPDVAVAVAISGGGERAANYGVGVLLGLEAMHALKEIDYLAPDRERCAAQERTFIDAQERVRAEGVG